MKYEMSQDQMNQIANLLKPVPTEHGYPIITVLNGLQPILENKETKKPELKLAKEPKK